MNARRTFTVALLTSVVAGLMATAAGAAHGTVESRGGGFEIIAVPQLDHEVHYDWGWTFQDAFDNGHRPNPFSSIARPGSVRRD